MLYVYCDNCKKNIPSPRSGKNYVTLFDKDLCIPCSEKLEQDIRTLMAREKDYHLDAFAKNQKTILEKLKK
jgi:hypothetical protein